MFLIAMKLYRYGNALTVIVAATLVAVLGVALINSISRQEWSELQGRGERAIKRIATSSSAALWSLDVQMAEAVLLAELADPELISIVIHEGESQDDQLSKIFVARQKTQELNSEINPIKLHQAITHNGTVIGRVELLLSRSYVVANLKKINYIIVGTGSTLALLICMLVLVFKTLVSAREKAIQLAGVKSAFLANMSHEIRTPMNGIIGLTNLVLEGELNDGQREHLMMVDQSAKSLLIIINDILDISKLDSGRVVLEEEPMSLSSCLKAASAIIQPACLNKAITFVSSIAPSIPDTLLGDVTRIGQVLTNLLSNAVKFTPVGGRVTLQVWADSLSDEMVTLHFTVSDSGIGIPEDKLQMIFEEFAQADTSTTRKYGGTGLGLSIARRIAEMMEGQLWVKSTSNIGSTFHFTAKLRVAPRQLSGVDTPALDKVEPPVDPITQGGGVATSNLSVTNLSSKKATPSASLRILVAEDNHVNQKLVLALIKKRGHQAELAFDGAEAVQKFIQSKFDLILMDMQMPNLSGLEATAKIRQIEEKQGGHIPIVALTANALDGDCEKCIAAGMDAYLTKPIRPEVLWEVVHLQTKNQSRFVPDQGEADLKYIP